SREVKRRIDDNGLEAVDMEVIRLGRSIDTGEALIEAACEVGAKNILVISSLHSSEETAEQLSHLCSLAKAGDITICLEFMKFTSVKSLSDALEVVKLVDAPNVGILLDLLHVVRSGTTFKEIKACDPKLFPYAQWCDGTAQPVGLSDSELIIDALDDRLIPAQGKLDALKFESLFDTDVPFSIEVRSKHLRENFPDYEERARYVLDQTLAAL
ncbi:MAG: sugar phosphate isomerase/epimerase, partial [Actinomycetota bacterium]|nr:sugar phosphate isomerase/epimerase [Actinomycetota bacterium]